MISSFGKTSGLMHFADCEISQCFYFGLFGFTVFRSGRENNLAPMNCINMLDEILVFDLCYYLSKVFWFHWCNTMISLLGKTNWIVGYLWLWDFTLFWFWIVWFHCVLIWTKKRCTCWQKSSFSAFATISLKSFGFTCATRMISSFGKQTGLLDVSDC